MWCEASRMIPTDDRDVLVIIENKGTSLSYELAIDNYITKDNGESIWLNGDGTLGRTTIYWLNETELTDSYLLKNLYKKYLLT